MLPWGNENTGHESNPIPKKTTYTYLSVSLFSANLTPPNKKSFTVKSVLKSHEHVSNS